MVAKFGAMLIYRAIQNLGLSMENFQVLQLAASDSTFRAFPVRICEMSAPHCDHENKRPLPNRNISRH